MSTITVIVADSGNSLPRYLIGLPVIFVKEISLKEFKEMSPDNIIRVSLKTNPTKTFLIHRKNLEDMP